MTYIFKSNKIGIPIRVAHAIDVFHSSNRQIYNLNMQFANKQHIKLQNYIQDKKIILELSLVTESISLKAPELSLPNVCGLHKTYYC